MHLRKINITIVKVKHRLSLTLVSLLGSKSAIIVTVDAVKL